MNRAVSFTGLASEARSARWVTGSAGGVAELALDAEVAGVLAHHLAQVGVLGKHLEVFRYVGSASARLSRAGGRRSRGRSLRRRGEGEDQTRAEHGHAATEESIHGVGCLEGSEQNAYLKVYGCLARVSSDKRHQVWSLQWRSHGASMLVNHKMLVLAWIPIYY